MKNKKKIIYLIITLLIIILLIISILFINNINKKDNKKSINKTRTTISTTIETNNTSTSNEIINTTTTNTTISTNTTKTNKITTKEKNTSTSIETTTSTTKKRCPDGYILDNNKCTKTIDAIRKCPTNTSETINDKCVNLSEGISTTESTCPDNQVMITIISLGGPDQDKCFPLYEKIYACEDGYTLHDINKCSITINAQ